MTRKIRLVGATLGVTIVIGLTVAAVSWASAPARHDSIRTSDASARSAGATTETGVAEATTTTTSGDGSLPTADSAIARALSIKAEVISSDRSEAKLTTWSAVMDSYNGQNPQAEVKPQQLVPDEEPVWLVATAGQFRPAIANGKTYSWGAYIFDQKTGNPLGSFSGPGEWPGFFDNIPKG
jgi:hypothetical protein